MNILDRLERGGERLYSKFWYRVLILFGMILIVGWISLWAHEFGHYWWARNILHDDSAYIEFSSNGLMGWTVVSERSFGLYLAGGLFSSIVLFVLWLFVASFPHKMTLPVDMSLFIWTVYQFVYGIFEGVAYWSSDYHSVVKTGQLVGAVVIAYLVLGVYFDRLVAYIRGDTGVDNKRNTK